MNQMVFFLEGPSEKEMLIGILPKIMPKHIAARFIVFEGKQDLGKNIGRKLRAWKQPDCCFVVIRDQDSGNCVTIKEDLSKKCVDAGKPEVLVRIACHELESFYLGDLHAVSRAIGPNSLARHQHKAKFRNPDALGNPAQELKKLAPDYQKVSGSRAIGPLLDINNNQSKSFNVLIGGIQRLIGEVA